MARIKFGSLLTDIRASIGGHTFQNSLGGAIIKNKGVPIPSHSQNAEISKGESTIIMQKWRNLTNNERLTWNQYATYLAQTQQNGNGGIISGQNVFFRYNYYIRSLLLTFVTVPVFAVSNKYQDNLIIENLAGVLTITFGRALGNNTEYLWVEISAQITASQKNAKGGTKLLKQVLTNGSAFDITSAYRKLFGTIPDTGAYVQMKWLVIDFQVPAWTTKANFIRQVG